jgi:hypothetical protein
MLNDPSDQCSIWQRGARIRMLNRYHRDYDYGAIVDSSLGQKSVEASSSVHSDHCEAQHRKYMAHHYTVDASDLIAEVVYLEATFALNLHLMRASLCKTCDHLCSGWKVVNRPRVLQVAHLRCPSNGADGVRGHMDLCASDPGEKRISSHSMEVGIELPHQLCYGWTVIL